MYTISTDTYAKSFVLNGLEPLTSYQSDERDVRSTQPGSAPLIANHGVRRRLLAATPITQSELNLENVARVVQQSLGNKSGRYDIVNRAWYCTVCLHKFYSFGALTITVEHEVCA